MHYHISRLALSAGLLTLAPAQAVAQDNSVLTDIIVLGQKSAPVTDQVNPEAVPLVVPDAANLVARIPGAAINDNGPLSGQVQYHGLTGDRVLTRINGQRFSSGGPNLMDPPLHYAPMVLIDHVELDRSVGPVRNGPSLGGSVNAVLKAPRFGVGLQVDLSAGYRGADNSTLAGGTLGYGSDQVRIGLIASHEQGSDMEFPGGTVASTSFERFNFGTTLGLRSGSHEVTLEYRRQETDPSGNPPFPMDIVYFNTDFFRATYAGPLGDGVGLELSAGHVDVDHLMDNHSLRLPPSDPARYRASYADTATFTGAGALVIDLGDGSLRLGGDYETSTKNVRITNPNNRDFYLQSVNRAQTERYGFFGEWQGSLGPVAGEVGIRHDRHRMAAGAPELGTAVPIMPGMLAMQFASSSREWSGKSSDLAGRFWLDAGPFRPRLVLAHKTRSPSAIERFSWLPTEASGGLADRNIYVGDAALKIEKAWIVEAGFDWEMGNAYARPTVFYRRIDDFVQGVSFDDTVGVIDSAVEMVAAMSGDPTPLRFANVDAEIYGADVDFGVGILGPLRIDGTASWVRGRRRDVEDDLYRIAPPNLRLALSWVANGWNAALEGVGFAAQHHVSRTNGEESTPGFMIANALFGLELTDELRLDGGIENLFDRDYAEHLSGYNRVMGSDAPVGTRLPGAGRSGFVRLSFAL